MIEVNIDKNKAICVKKLSEAEILHRNSSGNQTHIGLFEKSVSLDHISLPSLLFFKNKFYDCLSIIDPIATPEGTLRSPKMRQGRNDEELFFENKKYESTYSKINELIKEDDDLLKKQKDFFVMYGTLTNGRLFFILFSSYEYPRSIRDFGVEEIFEKKRTKAFPKMAIYLKLHNAANKVLKKFEEDESIVESIELVKSNTHKRFFTKKEYALIHKIGREGEELVNLFLRNKLKERKIKEYYWLSNDHPSADHDFEITDLNNIKKYIEVKTTKNHFSQPFYWSKNEMNLFLKHPNNYIFKRVSHIFDKKSTTLNTAQDMQSFGKKINIEGVVFKDGVQIYPSKVEINWSKNIDIIKHSK